MSAEFKPVPLTPEEIEQLDRDIEETFDRLITDLKTLRGETS